MTNATTAAGNNSATAQSKPGSVDNDATAPSVQLAKATNENDFAAARQRSSLDLSITSVAPSLRAVSTLCADPTTPIVRQPAIRASWRSEVPTPPAAEWTRTTEPFRGRQRSSRRHLPFQDAIQQEALGG